MDSIPSRTLQIRAKAVENMAITVCGGDAYGFTELSTTEVPATTAGTGGMGATSELPRLWTPAGAAPARCTMRTAALEQCRTVHVEKLSSPRIDKQKRTRVLRPTTNCCSGFRTNQYPLLQLLPYLRLYPIQIRPRFSNHRVIIPESTEYIAV